MSVMRDICVVMQFSILPIIMEGKHLNKLPNAQLPQHQYLLNISEDYFITS